MGINPKPDRSPSLYNRNELGHEVGSLTMLNGSTNNNERGRVETQNQLRNCGYHVGWLFALSL